MKNSAERPIPGLVGLCILLGIASLIFAGFGVWLLLRGFTVYSLLSMIIAVLSGAAVWGLNQRKKWGVILFGLLGMIGSVNHLARVFTRYADLSQAGIAVVLSALFSIVLAIIIPICVIYLTLLLWRRI